MLGQGLHLLIYLDSAKRELLCPYIFICKAVSWKLAHWSLERIRPESPVVPSQLKGVWPRVVLGPR